MLYEPKSQRRQPKPLHAGRQMLETHQPVPEWHAVTAGYASSTHASPKKSGVPVSGAGHSSRESTGSPASIVALGELHETSSATSATVRNISACYAVAARRATPSLPSRAARDLCRLTGTADQP